MQKTKTFVRRVWDGQTDLGKGLFNASEVDKYLDDTYLSQGWEVLNTHFGGMSDGGMTLVWILVKNA